MKKLPLLLLLLIFCQTCLGQFDSLGLNSKWHDGVVVLNDGSKLEGFIKVNTALGLIKFKETLTDNSDELSFQEKSLISMEYFDSDASLYRKYASINVKDDQTGFQGAVLFEIIFEFEKFAVVSKVYSISPAIRVSSNGYGGTYYRKVGYQQMEAFFLIGDDAKADPLYVSVALEKDKLHPFATNFKPFFDKKLIIKRMGPGWPAVKTYVKEKKLNLRQKYDLLAALEYYNELEQRD